MAEINHQAQAIETLRTSKEIEGTAWATQFVLTSIAHSLIAITQLLNESRGD